MKQGRFFQYPGKTLRRFGAGSYLNPCGQVAAPARLFRTAYPAGHRVEIMPGAHGQYLAPGNVDALAATILRHIGGPAEAQATRQAGWRPAQGNGVPWSRCGPGRAGSGGTAGGRGAEVTLCPGAARLWPGCHALPRRPVAVL